MGRFRKPEWLDSALGIAGFSLAVFSSLTLLEDEKYYDKEVVIIASIALCITIVFLSIFFRPMHQFKEYSPENISRILQRYSKNSHEAIIVNPSVQPYQSSEIIPVLISNNCEISLVGDAGTIDKLFSSLEPQFFSSLLERTKVSGLSLNSMMICFIDKSETTINILQITPTKIYHFGIKDGAIVALISILLKKETLEGQGYISLKGLASPLSIVSMARSEQDRYLRNFKTLQRGVSVHLRPSRFQVLGLIASDHQRSAASINAE